MSIITCATSRAGTVYPSETHHSPFLLAFAFAGGTGSIFPSGTSHSLFLLVFMPIFSFLCCNLSGIGCMSFDLRPLIAPI
jgi:hypothetical protein